MKPKTVTSDRFLTLLLEQLNARFQAADKETVGEGERVFLQTSLPVEFVVSAKKKPKPDSLPEPCCICFRAGAGFVCVGDCGEGCESTVLASWLEIVREVESLFGDMPDFTEHAQRAIERGTTLVAAERGRVLGGVSLSRDDRPTIGWLFAGPPVDPVSAMP